MEKTMDKIVALCKNRGFIYPGSEIYGGLANTWDYGNIGVEHCRLGDVKATAIGFYRKGRQQLDSTNGRKWRIYSWWWTRLLPLRRYLLFAMHPHVPRRFKKK